MRIPGPTKILLLVLLATACVQVDRRKQAIPPDNVPKDGLKLGDPDFNDHPFNPVASHRIQELEWLGLGVTEEPAPLPVDAFNDGVSVLNPRPLRPGRVLTFSVAIATAAAARPAAFPPASRLPLAVWVDWNYDNVFVAAENVLNTPINLRNAAGVLFPTAIVRFAVVVPPAFVPAADPAGGTDFPTIRARLGFAMGPPIPALGPGGAISFGEVEDVRHPINDIALVNAPFRRALLGKDFIVVECSAEGVPATTRTVTGATVEDLDLVLGDLEPAYLDAGPESRGPHR